MQKKLLQSFMLILVFFLVACGKEVSEDALDEVSEGISKATVINNALEQTVTSYRAKTEATVVSSSNNEQLEQTSTIDLIVQEEPFLIYYDSVYIGEVIKAFNDSEYYYLGDGERWYKTSKFEMDEMQELSREGYLVEEIKRLIQFEDIFELQYGENEYILIAKITDSADKKSLAFVTDYVENHIQKELDDKALKTTINEVKYTLKFNKDFLLTSANIFMNFNLYQGTVTSNTILSSESVYSDVNNINDFYIPEEIKRNATNMDELENIAR